MVRLRPRARKGLVANCATSPHRPEADARPENGEGARRLKLKLAGPLHQPKPRAYSP
ncbi:hypothetical protein SAMN05444521_6530 [Streptomyces sp. 3214.6]|nr:hypothetical protein SAMN05444521_6530 [Streptomyces sp. 3214.6]